MTVKGRKVLKRPVLSGLNGGRACLAVFIDSIEDAIWSANCLTHGQLAGGIIRGPHVWKRCQQVRMIDDVIAEPAGAVNVIGGDECNDILEVL